MRYLGLFYVKEACALYGLLDAPYATLGPHALCARETATDGGATALVNGRLRNEAALKKTLTEAGLCPRGDNSAALVLGAYRLYGEGYPERLEGPVSTAVIDQDANCLVLSRDRIGEQPVFYATRGGSVAFSDHPAALLDAPFVHRVVDHTGLQEIFGLGPARTPGLTPFRDIRTLEPGCKLIARGQAPGIVRYFKLEAREHEDDLPTTIERVRALLDLAMGDALKANPGIMLSGGLDSTALTGLCHRASQATLRTWSVGYENDALDFTGNLYQPERDDPYIERAVALFDTRHRAVRLSPDALAGALASAMRARGLPGMADVDSSLWLFARDMAQEERFALSGECADEVFGGYPWFCRQDLIASDTFPWSGSLPLRTSILKKSLRDKLALTDYVSSRYHEFAAKQPRLAGETPEAARLRQIQGLCFAYFMPNLQERAVFLCASSGLTVLTPYADDRLLRYVYNVPWSMKQTGGMAKGLLREAVADILPDDLRLRKKSPYHKTHNPVYAQAVCRQMAAVLRDPESPLAKLVDADELTRRMADGLRAADTPWYGQLMTGPQMIAYLLQVDAWLRTYRLTVDL